MKHSTTHGFTIVELLIVIAILSILTLIAVAIPSNVVEQAQDNERIDDVSSLARRLEQAYIAQDLGRPAYPSTSEINTDITGRTRTMSRVPGEVFIAPRSGVSNSVLVATSTSTTAPIAGGPTKNQYVYQPLTKTNALCTNANSSADPCIRFNLYYRLEDNIIYKVKSVYQQ